MAATAGANAGTSPPAPVLSNESDDNRGDCTFGTGTTPAAGAMVTLTTSLSWSGYIGGVVVGGGVSTPTVIVSPLNAAAAALQLYASFDSLLRVVTVSAAVAPAASQANTVYSFTYHIVG